MVVHLHLQLLFILRKMILAVYSEFFVNLERIFKFRTFSLEAYLKNIAIENQKCKNLTDIYVNDCNFFLSGKIREKFQFL